jgi:hypothetical protein
MSNWFQVRYDKPSKYLRSFRYNLNQWAGWNFDGDRLNLGFNVNAHAMFRNNWSMGTGANYNPQGFDDRATRGGPGVYGNTQRSIWSYFNTDERRLVSAGISTFNLTDGLGTTYKDLSPYVVNVSTGIRYSVNHDESQWIEHADNGDYVFGLIHQKTVALTGRLNYTVTPNLSIQLYAEPFVSAGDYSGFKALLDGRAKDYAGRYRPIEYTGNPDFTYRSFRTTNVLRWEYRPGSALFLVWQQGREDTVDRGTDDFKDDFGAVFDAPARNVFLVKWSYWLNY